MPRKTRTPGIRPRVLRRTNRTVYDASVSVDSVRKTRRGFANPTAAKAWQDDTRSAMRRGDYTRAGANMTLGDLIWDHWLPVKLAECRTQKSRDTYSYWANRIYGDLGALNLRKLTRLDVTAWRTHLVTHWAGATARGIFTCLVSAVHWAVAHELMAKDVTLATKRPSADPRDPPVLSFDVINTLLEQAALQEEPVGMIAWLGVRKGLRFGEIVSLTWGQVDFATRTIRLNRMVQKRIKTDAGQRAIQLTEAEAEHLRDYRERQMQHFKLELSAAPPRLVCVKRDGTPVLAPWFWWRWNAAREAAGVPWLHFHDARHIFATVSARAGVHPRVTQEALGHTNPALTLRVYAHVGDETAREAAEAVERAFGGKR